MRVNAASRARRGNVMIEFAISATLLIYVFSGVFQFGYSFHLYDGLVEAVRNGVRYASLAKISNAADSTIPSAYSTAVKNMVVYGTPTPAQGQVPVVSGLS